MIIYWLYLILAIMLEIAGTTAMKLSNGLTKPLPSIFMFVFYFTCFAVFSLALKKIELSTAYAVWSGVGTAFIAIVGVIAFKDVVNPMKIISILLIIVGVVGLNLSSISHG